MARSLDGRVGKSGIGGEEHQRMNPALGPARGILTAVPEIPDTRDRVDTEEHPGAGGERTVESPRPVGGIAIDELLAGDVAAGEEGDHGEAPDAVDLEPGMVEAAVLDRRRGAAGDRRVHRLGWDDRNGGKHLGEAEGGEHRDSRIRWRAGRRRAASRRTRAAGWSSLHAAGASRRAPTGPGYGAAPPRHAGAELR